MTNYYRLESFEDNGFIYPGDSIFKGTRLPACPVRIIVEKDSTDITDLTFVIRERNGRTVFCKMKDYDFINAGGLTIDGIGFYADHDEEVGNSFVVGGGGSLVILKFAEETEPV